MKTTKTILAAAVCIGACGIFAPSGATAQGTVYVSNTGEAVGPTVYLGSDRWAAGDFITGGNSTGYTLDSIQYLSGGADNQSDDFSLWLYADNGGQPGTSLEQLSGTDNPASAGTIYDYLASGIALSSSTTYWVVAQMGQRVTSFTYLLDATYSGNFISNDGWSMNNSAIGVLFSSNSGSTWSGGQPYYMQFGVTAEPAAPVPEPGTLALGGLGLGLATLFLRRKK